MRPSPPRAAVAAIDPGLPLANVRPTEDVVSAAAGQPRFTTLVASFFAGAAFLLAGVGLYGILAYSVRQRIREIGVRMALGASRREIFRLIIGDGMGLAAVGILVGIPAALAITRLMRGVLAGITTTDPLSYVAVVALLLLSACWPATSPPATPPASIRWSLCGRSERSSGRRGIAAPTAATPALCFLGLTAIDMGSPPETSRSRLSRLRRTNDGGARTPQASAASLCACALDG
jgi:hypothetical protein